MLPTKYSAMPQKAHVSLEVRVIPVTVPRNVTRPEGSDTSYVRDVEASHNTIRPYPEKMPELKPSVTFVESAMRAPVRKPDSPSSSISVLTVPPPLPMRFV